MHTWFAVLVLPACSNEPTDTSATDDADPTDRATDDTDTDSADTDATDEDFCSFTPCGGDVVGSWTIIGACAEFPVGFFCPTSTIDIESEADGTWVFDAAGTYTSQGNAVHTVTIVLPADCSGTFTMCAQWQDNILGTTCTGDVTVECTCTATYPGLIFDTGTWTSTPADLTLDSDFGDGPKGTDILQTYATCQEGDQLKLDLQGPFDPLGWTLQR